MLKRVEIENYRSCHNVVLDDLGPMTVLLGRNAVGKTNILRAIQWAAEAATSSEVSGDGAITLEVQLGESVYRYSLKTNISSAWENKPSEIIESLEIHEGNAAARKIFTRKDKDVELLTPEIKEIALGALTPCMPAIVSLLPADQSAAKVIQPLLKVLERIRYYPLEADDLDTSVGIVSREEYDSWLSRYSATDDPGNSVLMRLLHLFQTNAVLPQEIHDLLGSTGLGLVKDIRMDSFKSPDDPQKIFYYFFLFQPSEQSFFYFSSLSAGTQRIIRLIVSLLFDQSSVMLIEHPEDTIHRGLLRKVIDVLQGYSDQHQLIISSHSPVVFDTLDPKAVRLVTMEDDVTKVRALTSEELRAAKLFMEEEGSLSDFIETVEEE